MHILAEFFASGHQQTEAVVRLGLLLLDDPRVDVAGSAIGGLDGVDRIEGVDGGDLTETGSVEVLGPLDRGGAQASDRLSEGGLCRVDFASFQKQNQGTLDVWVDPNAIR